MIFINSGFNLRPTDIQGAIAHNQFKKMGLTKIKNLCKKKHVIFDLKNLFNSNKVDLKL